MAGLIRAFEKVETEAWLVIAGRLGWKYDKDFELIKNNRKSARIKYIGYVHEKHKPALIKMASCLVYPSFYEGFGFQPLEAMALGTPVIASQVTALPEVVGDAGLLINPYDENSLAQGLREILNNNALRARLVEKGLAQAKKFNWKNTSIQIIVIKIYNFYLDLSCISFITL